MLNYGLMQLRRIHVSTTCSEYFLLLFSQWHIGHILLNTSSTGVRVHRKVLSQLGLYVRLLPLQLQQVRLEIYQLETKCNNQAPHFHFLCFVPIYYCLYTKILATTFTHVELGNESVCK